MAEFAFEPEPQITLAPGESVQEVAGKSPWRLAGRRLLRNRIALAALVLFVLIVLVSFLAPVYAHRVAHTDPFTSNLSGTVTINGQKREVIEQGGGKLGLGEIPIGPTWHSRYLVGADNQGRDVMARVLYGGKASLEISIGSALFFCLLALLLGLVAGFFGRATDAILSRLMDLIWAFPVYLLAISIATVLLTQPNGLQWGFIHIEPSSLWSPTVIIDIIYVPCVSRPVRGQVLPVRE